MAAGSSQLYGSNGGASGSRGARVRSGTPVGEGRQPADARLATVYAESLALPPRSHTRAGSRAGSRVDERGDHDPFGKYKNTEHMTFMLFAGLSLSGTGASCRGRGGGGHSGVC